MTIAETPTIRLQSDSYVGDRFLGIQEWVCTRWINNNFSEVPENISLEFCDTYVRSAVPVWFQFDGYYFFWCSSTKNNCRSGPRFYRAGMYETLQEFLQNNFTFKENITKKLWVTLWEHIDD